MEHEQARNLWTSERLVFRSLSPDDQAWMFDEIESDPVNMFLSTPLVLAPPKPRKSDEWMDMWKAPNHLLLVTICLRPTAEGGAQPDGSSSSSNGSHSRAEEGKGPGDAAAAAAPTRIGILRLSYHGYGTSPHNRAAELGITLAARHQGRGYGTEAVGWAVGWAFRHANLHSVNLCSVEYNARAHRCYERCGFRLEGRRRQCCWHDRRWYDLLFFGILETEWEETRGGGEGGEKAGV